jgi:hypothetical protein
MFLKPPKYKKYSIFRILGNETPPRDEPDARLRVLEFILDNEPEFPNATKCWIVNCVHDRERREHICRMLAERNMYYVIVPIWRQKYLEAKSRAEKITQVVGINRARNLAIRHGQLLSEFTMVLDGDCFFSQPLWDNITGEIKADQKVNRSRKFYSTPSSRATFDHARTSSEPMQLAEPMLIFRHDSDRFFDENLPFGEGDKLRLLYELGHSQESGKHHTLLHENLCKSVGMVHHVTGSSYEIETDQALRIRLRNESLDRLIWQIDNPKEAFPNYASRQHGKPNDYWQKIHGWFDYRGQYSQFAWELPSGSRFVEVGSWQGASICYLATEFKNRNKQAELFAVDTWKGSPVDEHRKLISDLGGDEVLYTTFLNHMKQGGVDDMVKPMRMPSIEASAQFADESLDAVFIDASHFYKDVLDDIKHWYPKVKKGGKISGHDYVAGHKGSEVGVIRAVNEFFAGKNLEIGQAGRTWLHTK